MNRKLSKVYSMKSAVPLQQTNLEKSQLHWGIYVSETTLETGGIGGTQEDFILSQPIEGSTSLESIWQRLGTQ